ncbi:hypothetical protein [Candidatus Similichlamydia epinepheli]|uniref:hypothetical protein n=1 Tax=Candidatus Similichlamydia epinepheli TaxID=1903953 RepID=UPI000D38CACB|nr:hypothetical protein [Candidatus Similichlamydia epinepheli]
MVDLSEFVRCHFDGSPFQKKFHANTSHFLISNQILFCGVVLLENCVSVRSIASKVFLALFGGTLALFGIERAIDGFSRAHVFLYPFHRKIRSYFNSRSSPVHLLSILLKVRMLFYTIGLFFKLTTFISVFSWTLLSFWLFAYLIFDIKIYTPELSCVHGFWTTFLEDLILCLNVLMTIWFLWFRRIPIV